MTEWPTRMRVLQVMASGAHGGGADHLVGLMPALRDLGIVSEAAVGANGPLADRLAALGFPVRIVDLMRGRLHPAAGVELARILLRAKVDLIHYHGTRAAFYGAATVPCALARRLPTLYTAHGLSYRKDKLGWRRGLFWAAEAAACRSASRLISVSKADLIDLERRRFVRPGMGVHVPNCVDTARFHPGSKDRVREELGLPRDAFAVGTVARLVPQKSVSDLIAAVADFRQATLVIVGDGPQRQALERQAASLRPRVRFLGSRDDVQHVLRALDVFVLPSRWEGEPIAILEAMATGIPVIATATPGAKEILALSRAGRLVDIGDIQGLTAAMMDVMRHPEQAAMFAARGLEIAQSRRYAAAAKKVARVYEEVHARRS